MTIGLGCLVVNQPYLFAPLHWFERMLRGWPMILDGVQHSSGSPMNRFNATVNGKPTWVTVPMVKDDRMARIDAVRVRDQAWGVDVRNKLHSYYRTAPHRDDALGLADHWIDSTRNHDRMIDVVMASLNLAAGMLSLPLTLALRSSRVEGLPTERSERLVALAQAFHADTLVLGRGSEWYVVESQAKYEAAGIRVVYQDWVCPVPNTSVLDAIAWHGVEAVKKVLIP